MKKTIPVKSLVERANSCMLNSPDENSEKREAIFHFVSSFLHDTGNYKGFNYLTERDMKESRNGKSFGVLPYDSGNPEKDRFVGTDESRRFFY